MVNWSLTSEGPLGSLQGSIAVSGRDLAATGHQDVHGQCLGLLGALDDVRKWQQQVVRSGISNAQDCALRCDLDQKLTRPCRCRRYPGIAGLTEGPLPAVLLKQASIG
jgi:hypothetical protein